MRTVGREPARGDDQVDVRMVEQGACPRVEHCEVSDLRPDIAGARREPLDRGGGAAEQSAVDDRLMGEGQRTELPWERHRDQIVRAG